MKRLIARWLDLKTLEEFESARSANWRRMTHCFQLLAAREGELHQMLTQIHDKDSRSIIQQRIDNLQSEVRALRENKYIKGNNWL